MVFFSLSYSTILVTFKLSLPLNPTYSVTVIFIVILIFSWFQKREDKLDSILDEMRQGDNEGVLNSLQQQTKILLTNIQIR